MAEEERDRKWTALRLRGLRKRWIVNTILPVLVLLVLLVTLVSAGVSTGVGDHESKYTGKDAGEPEGDEQFEIDDNRSLEKMYGDIAGEGLQPVLNDYLYV